jgi:hypothetical protein
MVHRLPAAGCRTPGSMSTSPDPARATSAAPSNEAAPRAGYGIACPEPAVLAVDDRTRPKLKRGELPPRPDRARQERQLLRAASHPATGGCNERRQCPLASVRRGLEPTLTRLGAVCRARRSPPPAIGSTRGSGRPTPSTRRDPALGRCCGRSGCWPRHRTTRSCRRTRSPQL